MSTNVTNLFQAYRPIRFQVWYIVSIRAYPGGKIYLAFSYNVLLDTIMIVIQFNTYVRCDSWISYTVKLFTVYLDKYDIHFYAFNISFRYNTWRDIRMILCLLIRDGYPSRISKHNIRVVKVGSLVVWLCFTRLFLPSFIYAAERNI